MRTFVDMIMAASSPYNVAGLPIFMHPMDTTRLAFLLTISGTLGWVASRRVRKCDSWYRIPAVMLNGCKLIAICRTSKQARK